MKKNKIVLQKITELKKRSRNYWNGKRPRRRKGGEHEALTEKAVGAMLQIKIIRKLSWWNIWLSLILLPSLFQLRYHLYLNSIACSSRYWKDWFIMLKNWVSVILFFWSIHCSTSFPAKYRKLGLSLLTACNITFATNEGGELFCINWLKTLSIFRVMP